MIASLDDAVLDELRAILGDEARIDSLIREELLELAQIYGKGDDRRTEIGRASCRERVWIPV